MNEPGSSKSSGKPTESSSNLPELETELLEADALELWENQYSASGTTSVAAGKIDPDAIKAAKLLNTVLSPPVDPQDVGRPRWIGRFKIKELLGAGRFGVVWRAFDPETRREVALKVIRQSQMYDPAHQRRFLRECELAAKLDHPGIVPVYECGTIDGMPFLVMPVCAGKTLDVWRAEQSGPVPVKVAAEVARQLAMAAFVGHQAGVLHRDLKPGNIMVSQQAGHDKSLRVRILDFGLAIPMDISLRDTRGSIIAGTPVYMSPEQALCQTELIGAASDIFAIGAILYELLTGSPPFEASTLAEVIERLQSETAKSIKKSRSDVPADLEAICLKCLAPNPQLRYESAQALATDLGHFLNEQPVTARPAGRIHRCFTWCSLRRGQQQLALAIAVINLLIMLWTLMALPTAISQVEDGLSVSNLLPIVLPLFGMIIPLHCFLIWLAYRIRCNRDVPRSSLAGTVLSLFVLFYSLAVFAGFLPEIPSPAYQSNPFARSVAYEIVILGFGLMTLMFGMLWTTTQRKI